MLSVAFNINSIWHLPAVVDIYDVIGAEFYKNSSPKYISLQAKTFHPKQCILFEIPYIPVDRIIDYLPLDKCKAFMQWMSLFDLWVM